MAPILRLEWFAEWAHYAQMANPNRAMTEDSGGPDQDADVPEADLWFLPGPADDCRVWFPISIEAIS
jgi:hypothetical protein